MDISVSGLIAYHRPMTALPKLRMTVDEYLAWAEERPGRYELRDGAVFAMSPEGAGHAEKKGRRSRRIAGRNSCAPPSVLRTARRHDGPYR